MEVKTITDVRDLNDHYDSPLMEAKRNGIKSLFMIIENKLF